MNYIWGSERNKINDELIFSLFISKPCDRLIVCAVDSYRVFIDDTLVLYGPSRTQANYSKPSEVRFNNAKKIEIHVLAYNTPCYAVDFQPPFFGVEVLNGNDVVYNSNDFSCYRNLARLSNMPRYSRQRGFAEGYDLTRLGEKEEIKTVEVNSPTILEVAENRSKYKEIDFDFVKKGKYNQDFTVKTPWWYNNPNFKPKPTDFDVQTQFLDKIDGAFTFDYVLEKERTGFIKLKIKTDKPTEVFVVFDEYVDGKWVFRRGACNDFIYLKVDGDTEFLSAEPYALKYLKIICQDEIEVEPSMKTVENDFERKVFVSGDKRIENVFYSAENTFRQNAVDIYMDCPHRERAGWLCDSYFTAKAERLFTGESVVEKDFLNNFLICDVGEIPENVLPMCFPSQHDKNSYIPNWSMWFCLQVAEYFERTGDKEFIERAKPRIYRIIEFFDKYVNEFGLLENLESWVFVEWSISNSDDYVKGVNFPSNTLFMKALESVGNLYGDDRLLSRSLKMRKTIIDMSFNGEFFVDNAIRENGILKPCQNHISETCQYYALYFGLIPNKRFKDKMICEFGPKRKESCYPEIGRSNVFIGNYLRFFYLASVGEYSRVLDECLEYFNAMTEKTGTIWENDNHTASCNHGFTSSAGVLILNCLCGYKTVKDKKPIFEKDFKMDTKYHIEVKFDYEK